MASVSQWDRLLFCTLFLFMFSMNESQSPSRHSSWYSMSYSIKFKSRHIFLTASEKSWIVRGQSCRARWSRTWWDFWGHWNRFSHPSVLGEAKAAESQPSSGFWAETYWGVTKLSLHAHWNGTCSPSLLLSSAGVLWTPDLPVWNPVNEQVGIWLGDVR